MAATALQRTSLALRREITKFNKSVGETPMNAGEDARAPQTGKRKTNLSCATLALRGSSSIT